jgi:NhaC family Na+:H+ antiporter
LKLLILIGAVTGVWMAAGTIPSMVYYGLRYLTPDTFILTAFVITCMVSFMIGSSLGTVSIVGIPLIIIARSGNVNLNIVAGAIIAGAYFGDRCSPMSSSAYLVSNLTTTNIFINIKNMLYSAAVPFVLSLIFYFVLSMTTPLTTINNGISKALLKTFDIHPITLLPALIIIILATSKTRIDVSIALSILSAAVLSITIQHYQLGQIIRYAVFGFTLQSGSLQHVFFGGGIVSMLKTCLIVLAACSLAGIFKEIELFDSLKGVILRMRLSRHALFGLTTIVSAATAAFGCSQPIAAIMTNEIMQESYCHLDRYQLALDLENSAIVVCALIPWCTSAFIPTTMMNVSTAGFIPYAFYLYMLPIVYFISKHPRKNNLIKEGIVDGSRQNSGGLTMGHL